MRRSVAVAQQPSGGRLRGQVRSAGAAAPAATVSAWPETCGAVARPSRARRAMPRCDCGRKAPLDTARKAT